MKVWFHHCWTAAFLIDPVIVAEARKQLKLKDQEEEWIQDAR